MLTPKIGRERDAPSRRESIGLRGIRVSSSSMYEPAREPRGIRAEQEMIRQADVPAPSKQRPAGHSATARRTVPDLRAKPRSTRATQPRTPPLTGRCNPV